MRVELVAIGSELLYGDIVNGNAAWLGRQLADHGFEVTRSVAVDDTVETIAEVIREALGRAQAVVMTGGLGPTQDDLTRDGIALAAGVPLVRDDFLEAWLRRRFAKANRVAPEMNYKQADLPQGGSGLPNDHGSAPGVRMELLGGVAYALPGVPREMQPMFEQSVLPDLLARAGEQSVVVHRLVRTAGMWESAVAEAMAPEVDRVTPLGNPVIAFLASGGLTRVKITAKASTRAEAEALIAPVQAFAVEALGDAVFGLDETSLEQSVQELLLEAAATVSVAESLTGGLLASRLTAVPGASTTVVGGIVAYQTPAKEALLAVPADVLAAHGAVSEQTAAAMAEGVRVRTGSTYSLALTGVAGPDEQEGKPVGLVYLGLAAPSGTQVRELRLPGDRSQVREYAAVSALDLLRRHLLAARSR